jgi:hypothetical protein
MKKFIVLFAALALFVSACGADAEPTISAADVAASAEAAAWTMVAETQAALPTNTPIPPTNTSAPTPLPTNTPLTLPTQPPPEQPTSTSAVDRCDQPLPDSPAGSFTRLRLINETKAQVNLSVYLNETPFGECGYRGYQLNKGDTIVIEFVQGCYSFYAWVNAGSNSSTASGYGCANNSDMWNVYIRPEAVSIKPP